MPGYPQFATTVIPWDVIPKRVGVMAMLGVPYGEAVTNAIPMAQAQARALAADVVASGGPQGLEDKEIIAIVAYIQRLGHDIALNRPATARAP